MKGDEHLAPYWEQYFTKRLMQQRQASPHTIRSYRDTFCQLLRFLQERLRKSPSSLFFHEIDAALVAAFLAYLEKSKGISVRSRNLRLTAIHSFFRYMAFQLPERSAQIQRVLAIPSKRFVRKQMNFLTRPEIEALLRAPDLATWTGRRDHAFLCLAVQTGLRLSEITGLKRDDIFLGVGAHVRVLGKGRKERCVPIARSNVSILKAWLREEQASNSNVLFPSMRGTQLSVHGVQYMLKKHRDIAAGECPTLKGKRVTVHCLRHTAAMELLQAGVDSSVIALWLGHESVETTQIYLEATLAMKEEALSKVAPLSGKFQRYRPGDQLLAFLSGL